MIRVNLSQEEIDHCDELAMAGYKMATAKGYKDYTLHKDKKHQYHVQGARSEYAVAKWLQVPWNQFSFKNRNAGDVLDLEVRSRNTSFGQLIVRPRDHGDRKYVLVRSHRHPTYEIIGWAFGWKCKKPEWKRSHDHQISSYYLVPNEVLQSPYLLLDGLHV